MKLIGPQANASIGRRLVSHDWYRLVALSAQSAGV